MSVARPAATAAARRVSGLIAATVLIVCLGTANADETPGANANTEQLQEVGVTAREMTPSRHRTSPCSHTTCGA